MTKPVLSFNPLIRTFMAVIMYVVMVKIDLAFYITL